MGKNVVSLCHGDLSSSTSGLIRIGPLLDVDFDLELNRHNNVGRPKD